MQENKANTDEVQRFAPDKLLHGFTRTPFLKYLVLAILAHVLITAATSVPYVLDRIYPERVEAREQARKERERVAAEAQRPAQSAPTPAPEQPASQPDADATATVQDDDPLKMHSHAPVVKEITEMPKPGEIPDAPDDLGISIEQTNPR